MDSSTLNCLGQSSKQPSRLLLHPSDRTPNLSSGPRKALDHHALSQAKAHPSKLTPIGFLPLQGQQATSYNTFATKTRPSPSMQKGPQDLPSTSGSDSRKFRRISDKSEGNERFFKNLIENPTNS